MKISVQNTTNFKKAIFDNAVGLFHVVQPNSTTELEVSDMFFQTFNGIAGVVITEAPDPLFTDPVVDPVLDSETGFSGAPVVPVPQPPTPVTHKKVAPVVPAPVAPLVEGVGPASWQKGLEGSK